MMIDKSAAYIARAVREGEIKAREVAEEFLSYSEKVDKSINAFNSLDAEIVIKNAEAVDKKRETGAQLGPLAGVPFVIKDNILVKGEALTCSSKALIGYKAIYDAKVVEKIKEADGIPFGKSNMDEFAMGSSTENSAFFVSKNPWDLSRVPGGSSGGSTAAVASLMAPLALGTDTGGSIRQPASFCGLVGLKPTYGRVSRRGLVSFASSLDQIGPLARNVEDVALAMNVIAGHDAKDTTSLTNRVPDYLKALDYDMSDVKIAFLDYKSLKGANPAVIENMKRTVQILESLGATLKPVSMIDIQHSIEAYYIIAPAEVSSNLSRIDGLKYGTCSLGKSVSDIYVNSRTEGFGDEVKRRIMIGNYVLSAGHYDSYYEKAYRVRRVVKNQFDEVFKEFDLVLMPTSPTTAFKIGENTSDPIKMYLSDVFTTPANLAGLPAISFPTGLIDGLPVGMQLIGKYFEEPLLISAVSAFEREVEALPFRRLDV